MSWAQEGREQKQKELAKSEVYAETGVAKARKRPRKPFVIEWRYTSAGWDYLIAQNSWMLKWNPFNDWQRYNKYARRSDADKALLLLRDNQSRFRDTKEYKLIEKGV